MKKHSIFLLALSIILFTLTPTTFAGSIITVDDNSPADFDNIQAAINDANNGDTVLVKDGRYTGEGNRDIDFLGKAITVKSKNGPNNCIIDCNGTEAEPHRGFYFHSGEDSNSVLDGLTIINGYAPIMQYQAGSITYNYWAGGAIFCYKTSPVISNCRLVGNCSNWFGGAIGAWDSQSTITDCIIENNCANRGGGVHCRGYSDLSFKNCVIRRNEVSGGGGAIYCYGGSTVVDCLITGNVAGSGGGIYVNGDNFNLGSAVIENCTFSGNKAVTGGAMYCGKLSGSYIINCIFWDDSATNGPEITMTSLDWGSGLSINFSNIEGGQTAIYDNAYLNWGSGNIDTDPCFVNPGYWDANGTPDDANDDFWIDGDYHLLTNSPCINTGDPDYIPQPNEIDLDGNPRVLDGRIDMGAYEFLYTNQLPIADAGPNQIAYADHTGQAQVTLDGSASYDADDDDLSYYWNWLIDGDVCDTNGLNPTTELPVGEHLIELIVNDGTEDSEPNYTTVTVIEPMQADLYIYPTSIVRHNRAKRITALIRLPRGITKDEIDSDTKLILYPGGIEAKSQLIRRRRRRRVTILAHFDKAELMNAIENNGRVELQAVGRLKTGQYFYGEDSVRIRTRRRRRPNQ